MSKRAAQSPIDAQRKTKKQKKEIEVIPDDQAEFLEDTSISFITGIKNNGAIPLRDTTLMQKAFEQVEKVYNEMHKKSQNQDLSTLFDQLKKINERITNTEVKMALIGLPGAGKTHAANQILFSEAYLRKIDTSYEWGKVPLLSATAGIHMTRKIYYMKKGPEWSIKVRWDKNIKEAPAEVNLMKKYLSKGVHPFEVMTSIIRKLDPTLDQTNFIFERAAKEHWTDEMRKEALRDMKQQEPIFSNEEWNNITGIDIESPDFELAPGFVLMDTPGWSFEDKNVSREMVKGVVTATREAIEEADALIYVTTRLPDITQIKALFDPDIGAINTYREVPVLVCLWKSYINITESDAKTIVDHLRRLKSDWNSVLPRASAASKVNTQFDYFYERKRIFEQLEQRTLLFAMPGTIRGLPSFYQNVKSRVLMNDVVSFTRTVTTFYYGGKQLARKMLSKSKSRIPTGLSSSEETAHALTTAYQEPIEDAKQAFVQTLEDYFQFLIQESDDEIDIYLDNLCKDIGTCFSQFFKDIQTQSLKMVDHLIKRIATELSETSQREDTEVFITSIMDGMETQTRVFHTMRLRSDRIFDTAKKQIVQVYRSMSSEVKGLQDFDEDEIAPYKKKFVNESFQQLIILMERCYKQMIQRTHGIIEKCGNVLKEFAELRIDNTAQFEKDLSGLSEAVDAYKATLKSQMPTEFKEFSVHDPIPRVIKGADFFQEDLKGDKKDKPTKRPPTIKEEAKSKLADNVMEVFMPENPAFSFNLSMNEEFKKKIEEFRKISDAKLSMKDKKEEDVAEKNSNLMTDISSTPPSAKRKIIHEPIVLLGDFSEKAPIGLKHVAGAKVLVVIITLQKHLKKVLKLLEEEDVPQEIKNDVLIVAVQHPKDLSDKTIYPTLLDVSKMLMEHWQFSFYWRFSLNVFNACREYYLPVDTTRSSPLLRCLKFHSDVLASYCSVCIEKIHALCDMPQNNQVISMMYVMGTPRSLAGKPFTPEMKSTLLGQNFQLLNKLQKKECSFQELLTFVEQVYYQIRSFRSNLVGARRSALVTSLLTIGFYRNLDDLVDKLNEQQYLFVESLKDVIRRVATFTLVDDRNMLKETRAAFPMLFRKCNSTQTSRATLLNTYAMKGLWYRKKKPLNTFDDENKKEAGKDFYDGLKKAEGRISTDLKNTGSLSIKITYFGYSLRKSN